MAIFLARAFNRDICTDARNTKDFIEQRNRGIAQDRLLYLEIDFEISRGDYQISTKEEEARARRALERLVRPLQATRFSRVLYRTVVACVVSVKVLSIVILLLIAYIASGAIFSQNAAPQPLTLTSGTILSCMNFLCFVLSESSLLVLQLLKNRAENLVAADVP